MALTNDIELNGVSYNVVPGTYKKGLRKPQAVSKPPARRIGQAIFGPFGRGVLPGERRGRGTGLVVADGGAGLRRRGDRALPQQHEPRGRHDRCAERPRCGPTGWWPATAAYVGIGRRIYKSVALTNGTWASFTVATDLGAGLRDLGADLLPGRHSHHAVHRAGHSQAEHGHQRGDGLADGGESAEGGRLRGAAHLRADWRPTTRKSCGCPARSGTATRSPTSATSMRRS